MEGHHIVGFLFLKAIWKKMLLLVFKFKLLKHLQACFPSNFIYMFDKLKHKKCNEEGTIIIPSHTPQ
jgi:hypothetical protein